MGQQSGSTENVFNITGSSIKNLTASGNIYDQSASKAFEASEVEDETRSRKTILIVSANPRGTSPLRLDEEVREIQRGLERSQYREGFQIEQRSAVTVQDLRRALLDCQPQIVHFSGHGMGVAVEDAQNLNAIGEEGLVLEDETGQMQLVSGEAMAQLFSVFLGQIECVVLNACYSANQARQISQHVPQVIGMKQAIGDRAAIAFAIGFYDGIFAGRSVDVAYQLGCNSISLMGISENMIPHLISARS